MLRGHCMLPALPWSGARLGFSMVHCSVAGCLVLSCLAAVSQTEVGSQGYGGWFVPWVDVLHVCPYGLDVWIGCGMRRQADRPSTAPACSPSAQRGGIRSDAGGQTSSRQAAFGFAAGSPSDWLTSRDVLHARAPRRAACRFLSMLPLPGPGLFCTATLVFPPVGLPLLRTANQQALFLCMFRCWRAPRGDPAGWQ